jgi:hypothetical protein
MIKKIGLEYFKNNPDVNGGYHEYLLINDAIKDIKNIDDVIVLINGAITDDEHEQLSALLINDKRKKIFIATDMYCLDKCSKIASLCDYVLGQFRYLPNEYNWLKNYMYSYVPELFYDEAQNQKIDKIDNILFFGGGLNDGRDATLAKYHVHCDMKCYVKQNDNTDNRIPYDQYCKDAAKYKYHLIIARDLYTKYHWVTPRYVECISMGSIPVVDTMYDANNHFKIPTLFRAQAGLEAKYLMKYCNAPENTEFINDVINDCKVAIKRKQTYLKEIIEDIIKM